MTQPKQPGNATAWHVTAQNEGMGKLANGAFTQGVNVTFTTSNGTVGSVFIPASDYTAEKVRAAIHEKVTAMHAVNNLTGQVG